MLKGAVGSSPATEAEILRRVQDGLAQEIRLMLDEGVVPEVEDIDLCLILGAGWPFIDGGASPYLDREGASERVFGDTLPPPDDQGHRRVASAHGSERGGPASRALPASSSRAGALAAARSLLLAAARCRSLRVGISVVAGRATGIRVPSTCETTSCAIFAGSEPGILEDLLARRVVDELVGHAELVDGGVDARLAQHLTHARADAADADAVLDRDDEAMGCRELDDRRLHRHDPPRVDDRRADPLRPQPLARHPSAMCAIGPMPTMRTSCASERASTSTPSARRSIAGRSGLTPPLGNRMTVGASPTATASRSSSRSRSASRGTAIRMCGTICSIARSQMPWWLGPSGPVTPARSSTNVTPARWSATSISTWSKARFMNVA